MLKVFSTVCALRRCRSAVTALSLAMLLTLSAALPAVEVEGLYSVQVPLDPNDPDARESAYKRALQQILIRVTGSEDAAFSPELNALFPNPARFVMQFRPGEDESLWVLLDGAAIEQVLRRSAMPVWGSDRPLTVLWIAVDWGRGQRELLTAQPVPGESTLSPQQQMRERIKRVATARGLPIVLPNRVEEEEISLSDVWGGFHDRLITASRQYNASSVLVGRLRAGEAERNRWNYYAGADQRQWNGEIEDAVHLLADTLAGQLAFAGNARAEAVMLTVSNVNSAQAFATVQGIIDGLEMIDAYTVDTVSGNRIRYRININGGARRLASVLDLRAQLRRAPLQAGPAMLQGAQPAAGSADSLDYEYRP
jgi:uncharacterized protein